MRSLDGAELHPPFQRADTLKVDGAAKELQSITGLQAGELICIQIADTSYRVGRLGGADLQVDLLLQGVIVDYRYTVTAIECMGWAVGEGLLSGPESYNRDAMSGYGLTCLHAQPLLCVPIVEGQAGSIAVSGVAGVLVAVEWLLNGFQLVAL